MRGLAWRLWERGGKGRVGGGEGGGVVTDAATRDHINAVAYENPFEGQRIWEDGRVHSSLGLVFRLL